MHKPFRVDVQEKSCHQCRTYFCDFYYSPDSAFSVCNFYGQIERFVPRKNKVVFKRIMIDGIVSDGPTSIKGKEDHVWMDMTPFQDYAPGDCLRFHADIYRYMKTGTNGKLIDYSLRNPHDIKTSSYKIPSDDEIINQQLEQLVCETCMYHDHCYFNFCMDNEFEKKERFETLKNLYDYSLKISR